MAETREILIEIEVDNNKAQQNLERTTSQLRVLQNERKELNKQVQQSSAQLRAEGTTRAEVNRRIVENGLATKRLSEEKRRATKEVNLENNSLNALRNNLSKLTAERNNTNTATREGAKRFQELNKQILAQNTEIRKLEEAGGDFRRNVGNYGNALDSVIPGFSALTTGIINATKAAVAFIATPLGALLAALGLAFGAVVTALTRTQGGIEKLRIVTATLSTAWEFLLDIVAKVGTSIIEAVENPQEAIKGLGDSLQSFVIDRVNAVIDGLGLLGSAIQKVFKGEFEGALDDATEGAKKLLIESNPLIAAVTELGEAGVEAFTEIQEGALAAAEAAGVLEAQLISIEKAENDLILTRAQANRQIAVLRQQAEDRGRTEEERIEAIQRAAQIERNILNEEIRLAQQRANIIIEQNKLTESTEEDRKRELEALAQVEQLQQRSFNLQKSLTSRLEGIKREAAARDNKRAAEERRRKDEADAKEEARIERERERAETEREAELELRAFRLEQEQFDAEALIQLEQDKLAKLLENEELVESQRVLLQEQSQARIQEIQTRATNQIVGEQQRQLTETASVFGNLNTALNAIGVDFKAFAIAQAVTDTYAAANAALRSGSGLSPVAGIAAAAAAIGTGLANVARITSTKFANGGLVNGPSHANGGVKFAVGGQVNELEGGEAVINKRSTAMFKPLLSRLNVAGGGVKFADGGITKFQTGGVTGFGTANEISAQNESNAFIQDALLSAPAPVVSVTEINDVQDSVQVTEQTASL